MWFLFVFVLGTASSVQSDGIAYKTEAECHKAFDKLAKENNNMLAQEFCFKANTKGK